MNDESLLALLLQGRSQAEQQKLALVLRRIDQIDRRVSQIESTLRGLTGQVSEQGDAIRMMCSVLKEFDDPYGFGQSLDERVFGDAELSPDDERHE
jgi:hypothetical protein